MAKSMRCMLAIWTAKCLRKGLKLLGRNGTHLPGVMALRICPDLLARIEKPQTIIGVTGTNGKTTVSNLIGDVLQANGIDYVDNRFGSNIDTGITTALIGNLTVSGKLRKNLAVLEIDERMTPRILPHVHLDYLVVTNLFRDSYKRNAHAEFITDILEQNISEDTMLILNAEDLISSHLKQENPRCYFGLTAEDLPVADRENIIQDMRFCPVCETPLVFDLRRYHHIGKAHCPNCDYGSYEADFSASAVDYAEMNVTISNHGESEHYRLIGQNMTDLYNETAAVALLRSYGLTSEQVQKGFSSAEIVVTRFDEMQAGKHKIVMNLAKGQNPIACSRVFDFVRQQPGQKAVLIMIDDHDDNKYSSENIAWLFDADFEYLTDESITQVIVGGKRHLDFRMRLRLAGMEPERIFSSEQPLETAELLIPDQCDTVFVLDDLYTYDEASAVRDKLKIMLSEGDAE